jgi:uncharacterized protein (DUF1684 family)
VRALAQTVALLSTPAAFWYEGTMKALVTMLLLPALLITGACQSDATAVNPAQYEEEILAWRAQRLANLKQPYGFLNLVGLYWLGDGATRIGSADDNDIVFPEKASAQVGILTITDDGVMFTAEPGVDVRYEDFPVDSILIADDTTDNPVALTHGSLAWTIIRRDNRFALRLRDFEHPALENFGPLEYYPIDPEYRVVATLQPYAEPRVVNVDTTIVGLGFRPESPGKLRFELGGSTYELEAYASGDSLFLVFGDKTSGRETYPAGRFLYTDWPDDDGKTVLDFNKAYSPPCAFNSFATCPVASPRNRLGVRIEAGELYDPDEHLLPEGY